MPPHSKQLLSEPIELFFAIDTLWFECQREGPRDGEEAHETLFGEGALIAKLKAADLARERITKTIRGPVRTIADFAVTSGHEALTVFAGRLASFTRVRRRHIPDAKAELEQEISGRTWSGSRPLGLADVKLHDAQVAFAKCVSSALRGWWEHRAWLHRSIVEELADPNSGNLAATDRGTTGKDAAKLIGVEQSTLSRWQAETPAWAMSDEPLFEHLMERRDRLYYRERVARLAKWHLVARADGYRKPVVCP